jgi:hypothetical protein
MVDFGAPPNHQLFSFDHSFFWGPCQLPRQGYCVGIHYRVVGFRVYYENPKTLNPTLVSSTLANSTLIILFSEMFEIFPKKIISSKSKKYMVKEKK